MSQITTRFEANHHTLGIKVVAHYVYHEGTHEDPAEGDWSGPVETTLTKRHLITGEGAKVLTEELLDQLTEEPDTTEWNGWDVQITETRGRFGLGD